MIDWDNVITVSEKKQQQLDADYATWKQERAVLVAAIVVQVGDHLYQGDEQSQSRMVSFVVASSSDSDGVDWVMADNTVARVTIGELREALRLAGLRQAAIWNDGRPVI